AAHFVTQLPVLNAVRRQMPVDRSLCSPNGVRLSVAILDQISGALRAIGEADADQRFGAGQFAELAELINTDVVGIDPSPIFVKPRLTQITVADALFPMVTARIDAGSAPTNYGWMNCLHYFNHIAPPAAQVFLRHERDFVHPEVAWAFPAQFKHGA